MNRILFTMLILGTLIACNQSKTSHNTSDKIVTIDTTALKIAKIQVVGMTCSGCENTVSLAMKELQGVMVSEVSHVDSLAVIKFDTNLVKISDISEAIQKTGYAVEDIEVLPRI